MNNNPSVLIRAALALIAFVALISMGSCISERWHTPKSSPSASAAATPSRLKSQVRMVNDYTEGGVNTILARGEVIRFDAPDGSFVCWAVSQGSVRISYHDQKGVRKRIDVSSVDERHVVLPKGHRLLKVEGLVPNTRFGYRVSFDTPCRDPSKI